MTVRTWAEGEVLTAQDLNIAFTEVTTLTPWVTVSLQTPWTLPAGYAVPRYRLDRGVVELQGRVAGGASGSTILVLPAGHRPTFSPTEPLIFTVDNSTGQARLAVYPDGRVVPLVAPIAPGMSINIRFSV